MFYLSLSKVAVSWALALLGLVLASPGSAWGQVQDPFTGATPSFNAAPEKGTNYNSGDWGVSDQNGAVSYSVPIDVPPGRNGMAPSLSLRYSSNLPLRGGLAVGWTFDMASIEVDLTLGAAEGVQYKIDLGSVSGRLIEVPDDSPYPQSTSYRVQFDNSNTRIFFIDASQPGNRTAGWIALTPDGVRHHFERVPGAHSKGIWNITRQVDSFGNTVVYQWSALFKNERVLGQSLVSIEYSSNAEAGIAPHAKIVFDYAPLEFCEGSDIPIGAAYRRGSTQVTGSQTLDAIKVLVRDTQTSDWSLRKQVDLSYRQQNSVLYERPTVLELPPDDGAIEPERPLSAGDLGEAPENEGVAPLTAPRDSGDLTTEAPENVGITTSNETAGRTVPCGQNPLRYLTQIDVKAFDIKGSATVLPPIRFAYNDRHNLSQSVPQFGDNPMREVTVNVPGFGQEGISAPHLGGLQTTLLDIDNDGVRDRVWVVEENRVCTLVWTRGLRNGSFEELERKSPLPTAAWYDEWTGDPGSVLDGLEGCTLSGQVAYRSTTVFFGDGTKAHVLAPGHLSYQFMDYTGDGRLDLITNVWATSRCFESYDPWAPPFASLPTCSFGLDLETGGGAAPSLQAEKDGDRFVWRVYPGTGDPDQPFLNQTAFAPQGAFRVRSPVTLPLPAGENALDLSTVTHYSVPTLFDIDGDGFLDAIDTKSTTLTQPCSNELLLREGCDWTVYFGDGTGSFPETLAAHKWEVPKATLDSDNWEIESCDADFLLRRSTVIGLRDINGDGLADLVVQLSDDRFPDQDHHLFSYRNTGSGFDGQAQPLNGDTALEQVQTDCDGFVLGGSLRNGDRGYQRRLVDLDADGLLDMVWFEGGPSITATNSVKAKFNMGGRFGETVTLLFPEKWALGKRLLAAEWESDDFVGNWHIVNDFTDVTGDGLADLVQWHAAGAGSASATMSYVSSPGLTSAPDLLSRVTNGRGMVLSFSYTPSTNRDVVDWGGSVSTLPTPRWVVSKSIVEGGFGTPATTTQYEYKQPNYHSAEVHSDFKERSQFAGFSQNIQTTNYSNGTSQQVRKLYDYEDEGLHADLTSIRTFLDGQLHRVVRNEWLHESIFGDRINQSLHVLTATCTTSTPTMGETECFSQADRVHRTEKEWQFSGDVRQFLNTQVHEGFGIAAQPGDRHTNLIYDNLYDNIADPEDYRIRVSEKNKTVGDAAGNLVATGRMVMQFDTETGLVDLVRRFRDDADTPGATRYDHDPETGNVLSIQKPLQNEILGATTTFRYDSNKLFVEETSNELEQRTRTTFDVATGGLLKREGPNFVSVAATPISDIERWQLDGFGRVLSRSISLDTEVNNSPTYEERTVERFTYNDANFFDSGAPASLRSEQLLDFDDSHFIPVEQDFDGRGRVLATRQLLEGDMDTMTTFKYAEAGGVQTVETVDPRDNSNRITFSYRHDGLGRVTDFTRPDGTGTSIAYAGMEQTVSEVAPDGSGGSKTKKFDALGRLNELQEHDPGGDTAVTRYEYDANDNLSQITDAEENVTQMSHDWLGNRIAVDRGERNWQYRYDLNGNLISKQSPVPLGADAAHYRTTSTYDVLDRMLTQSFVDMRLSSPPASSSFTNTLAEAGFAPEMETIRYHYDQAQNSIGRLRQVELPFGQIDYSYDVRGLVTREQRSLALDGPVVNTTQQVDRSYNALGLLTRSRWHDGQEWRINYDERGLVSTVDWFDPQVTAWLSVADYDREMTGLPELRRTDFGQTRSYTYDALARPLTDVLTLNGQTTALAERSYAYTDAGDLAAVVGQTNDVRADADFGYDAHHRLLSADGPNGYSGRFTYSPTGNVRSADVTWDGTSEARNVNYTYGQVDPQAVDELVDTATGDTFAAFLYDDVGNMTWRSTPGGDQLLHWDGRDQIRSADTGEGLETYSYDHTGQRALAVSAEGGVRFWFGERETHLGQDGSESLNYLHLSAGGPSLARIENGVNIELQYADALKNSMFSLDRVGNVQSSFLYGAFGEVVLETGGDEHRRQFNGKESDAATGLRYYGFRYYDPLTLRWNSADPLYSILPDLGLNEPQRMNLYAFSMNNPVRYYDADGRAPKDDEDDGDTPKPVDCEEDPGKCDDDDTEPEDDKPSREDRTKKLMRQIRERINACQTSQCVTTIIATVATQLSTDASNYDVLFEATSRAFSREIGLKDLELLIKGDARVVNIGVPDPGGHIVTHTMQDELNQISGPGTSTLGAIMYGAFRYGGKSHEVSVVASGLTNFLPTLGPPGGSGSQSSRSVVPVTKNLGQRWGVPAPAYRNK